MTNSKTRDEAFEAWFAQQRTRFTNAPLSEKTKRLMEPAYQAGRRAALMEAAEVCEGMRDLKEAARSQKAADKAIDEGDESEMLHRLRHCSNVSLFNGALERAARSLRALAGEGMKD